MAALRLFWEALRDLIIGLLPSGLVRSLVGQGEFVFLVHPLNREDAAKKYPFARNISEKIFELWSRYYWTVIGAPITGLKNCQGRAINGWVVICPFTPLQMMKNPNLGRKKILGAAKFSEKIGVRIIGLGGFNSILTKDGQYLTDKVKMGITTGNAYSAALAIQNTKKATDQLGLDLRKCKVAIIGAAGSVGSACSKILADQVGQLILIDINNRTLKELAGELGETNNLEISADIEPTKQADIILTVTSTPGAIVASKDLKAGAIVIDAAQPKNVSEEVVRQRPDVLVIDSGIARVSGINFGLDMGLLGKDEIYACLAETLILAWHNWEGHYALGKTEPRLVKEIAVWAEQAGFSLAPFRNIKGYLSNSDLEKFKKYLANKA